VLDRLGFYLSIWKTKKRTTLRYIHPYCWVLNSYTSFFCQYHYQQLLFVGFFIKLFAFIFTFKPHTILIRRQENISYILSLPLNTCNYFGGGGILHYIIFNILPTSPSWHLQVPHPKIAKSYLHRAELLNIIFHPTANVAKKYDLLWKSHTFFWQLSVSNTQELTYYKITTTTLNYIASKKFHTNMGN